MDRKECRIDRSARTHVRCIETVGAVDAGCHRLAEQSVGGNGRRRHCPHRSQSPQRPVDAVATFDYHTFNYASERKLFLPFLEVAPDLDGVHERTSHGLRQRGPFGFGPRTCGCSGNAERGPRSRSARTTSSRRRTAGAVLDLRRRGQPVFRLDVCRALQAFRLFGPPLRSASRHRTCRRTTGIRIDSPVSGGVPLLLASLLAGG